MQKIVLSILILFAAFFSFSGVNATELDKNDMMTLAKILAKDPEFVQAFLGSLVGVSAADTQTRQDGMSDKNGMTGTQNMISGFEKNAREDERVHVFISFSCPYCEGLWKGIAKDPRLSEHIRDDVDFWFLPRSEAEAGVSLVNAYIQLAYGKKAGADFANWFFDHKPEFASMTQPELFREIDGWLKRNGRATLIEIHADQAGVRRAGEHIQRGISLADKYGVTGYPTIIVNGREDADHFTKALEGR